MTLISHEYVQAPAFHGLVASPHLAVMDEKPTDYDARENLLDKAVWAHSFEKTAERLRTGHRPATHLALVAIEDDEHVVTLRLWPISAGDVPALLLGPLAVAKTHRSRGLGHRLMNEALIRAEAEDAGRFCLSVMRLIMRPLASVVGTRATLSYRDRSMRRGSWGLNLKKVPSVKQRVS